MHLVRCTTLSAPLRLLALALALAAPGAGAQLEAPRDLRIEAFHDSGWASNDSGTTEVVIAFTAGSPGATSLRLYFTDIQLAGDPVQGTGAILRLTSLLDGAIQTLDAVTAAQWQSSSAYFNGDLVLVEVLAQPHTGASRVILGSMDTGYGWSLWATQCGPFDDRVLSADPRAARVMPVACTGWMIADCGHCFLTAGHCASGIGVAQFNVPPSTAGGALVSPPPQDQYAVDPVSIATNFGQGTGNDYAYFGCFPNSNTGLTPFEKQQQAYVLAAPPVGAQTIRITGYGTDTSPLQANQVQQTSVGPYVGFSGTTLTYQTDTTGGNSGSPIIWEQTGQAIGIHTHGGCSSSGSGANLGTSILLPALQSALKQPKGVCAVPCSLSSSALSLSLASGGAQVLVINAGVANAGRSYWMLGSATGTTPGLQVKPGVLLNLNTDSYFDFTVSSPNSPALTTSFGVLDGQGRGFATLVLPAGLSPSLVGLTLNHACLLTGPIDFASNPVSVTFAP